MKKIYLFLLTMLLASVVLHAQPVEVGYFTLNKTMDPGAATASTDPIIRLLEADANFNVTVNVVLATDTVDLSGYDIVVVQENFGSGDAILKAAGSLGLEKITVPFLYNKTYALRNTRAITQSPASTSAEATGMKYIVPAANQANALFNGVTFDGDTVILFKETANDLGAVGTKALNYTYNLKLTDTLTLLAYNTAVTDTYHTVFFNDIPAGTRIGDQDTLKARMIAVGMNFGALCRNNGTNLTVDGLTIWRNAIYSLAGLPVPTEPAVMPKWKVGYFALAKTMENGASDPIVRLLQNEENIDLTVNFTGTADVVDISGYDALIINESYNSGDAILKPAGSLGLEKIEVPFLYNKTYALRNTRAITQAGSPAPTSAEATGTTIIVPTAKQSNALFNGVTFVDSAVNLFNETSNDLGAAGTKAMNYTYNLKLTDTLTLLAFNPAVTDTYHTIFINDIKAGTRIGDEDTLKARMIALGMNYGALCRNNGQNPTADALTIWRNAVYSLLGFLPPDEPAELPKIKVGYFALLKTMDANAAPNDNDGIIQLLRTEENAGLFDVTVNITGSSDVVSTEGYDVIIVQENYGSGDNILKPAGSLGLEKLSVPFLYNKTYALRNTRAITQSPASTSAEATGTSMIVPAANKTNALFRGVVFDGDTVNLFNETADDLGATGTKALNYTYGLKLTDTLTLLAYNPAVTDTYHTVFFNDIPAGTQIGDQDTLKARMIAVGMNYGALCRNMGMNLTGECFTIWRNAIFSLAGLSAPNTPAAIPFRNLNYDIIIITDDTRSNGLGDVAQVAWLEKQNFKVEKFNPGVLGLAGQDTIDKLNAADLVIIGRSPNSNDFGNTAALTDSLTRRAWNDLTVPVILNSPYISRSSRLRWINSTAIGTITSDTVYAKVFALDDTIFTNVTIEADSTVAFQRGTTNLISNDSTTNGEVLAYYGTNSPLIVRWEDTTFYDAAVKDSCVGPRTLFQFGYDAVGTNNFPLTDAGKEAYYAEICRLLGVAVDQSIPISSDAFLKSLAVNNGTLTPTFDSSVTAYTVPDLLATNKSVYVTAAAHDSKATVTGTGLVSLATSLTANATIVVTAEDLYTTKTYTVALTRAANTDATLKDLMLDSVTIVGFASDKYEYDTAATVLPEVSATPTDANAEFAIVQADSVNNDTATVTVTAEDGTTVLVYTVYFNRPNSVIEFVDQVCRIYPNPAKDMITIEGLDADASVTIINTLGQKVLSRVATGNTMNISLAEVSQGIYFVNINKGGKNHTIRLIKN